MTRTTITISDELLKRLRKIATERDVSMATVIREALEEKVNTERPKLHFLGIGDSGHTDIAKRSAEERPGIRDWR